jgi:hypothetical protein
MAKWKVTDQVPFDNAIRIINYVSGTQRAKDAFGNESPETPVINWRMEQFCPWGWQPVPVYYEEADGTLTEIPE